MSRVDADLLLHNARIYTVDPAQPWAEAVACADGRIVAVGSTDQVMALVGPETRAIDAAVTRQDGNGAPEGGWYPEERLTVAEAVHAYTMGPALAAGKEHLQGSVTPGK